VQRGRFGENRTQRVGIVASKLRSVEMATKSLGQLKRSSERPLQRNLLVEHHADQQRQRVTGQQIVRFGDLAQVQSHLTTVASAGQVTV
jgi:hypothetical protein